MKFFLAGIMQGSMHARGMHGQNYRETLRALIEQHVPAARVYCPLQDHRQSLDYGDGKGRDVFFKHNRLAAESDVLVAYLPEASMGTAVEMWEAYQAGRIVLCISPMRHNWVVRFLSHRVFADLEEFESATVSGELSQFLQQRAGRGANPTGTGM